MPKRQPKKITVIIRDVDKPEVQAALTRLANALVLQAMLANMARDRAEQQMSPCPPKADWLY